MKHAELTKTCTSFPGGGGVTVNLFWFHWISNFQLKPVPGQSSPEAPARTHMLSPVCTWDICIHGQLQTPNFSPFFSTELLFFAFRGLYLIMLGSICPIYPAPSWLQRSFRQWVWTHKCWHRDYLPCEEQFNHINLWEIPSASSLQIPTAKDWHNLTAYGVWPPQEEAIPFPRMPNPVFLLGLAPLQCSLSALGKGQPEGHEGLWRDGAGDCTCIFHTPELAFPQQLTQLQRRREQERPIKSHLTHS